MFRTIKRIFFSLDIVLLFAILSLAYFKDFFLSCINYLDLSFNSQIPLTWDFTSANNMFPYRDIYFPYGILFYFKNISPFLAIIYFFLPTVLFISIYISVQKLFRQKYLAIIAFVTFYLFINKYTGIENFTRYGIILSIGLLFSYIFYKSRVISVKVSFLLGLLIGGTFSLVNDQGIYAFILFIFLLVITPFLRKPEKLIYFKYLFSRIVANGFGIVLGILPFLIFLYINDMTGDFLLFIKHLSDFPLYAKTPFIPFSTTIDNLFTFGTIFIAIVILSYKIFLSQEKPSFANFLEINIVFILILLEQKNLIRSIDKQITFIAFFLCIIMFYELIKNKINKSLVIISYGIISGLILLGFGLHPFINYKLEFKKNLIGSFFHENVNVFLSNKSSLCLDDNLTKLITGNSTKFEKVTKIIEKDAKGHPKIFDYLSDPVFYVLFNQKPPYYFTIFEATPFYAQEANIEYMNKNAIKYIIYNEDIQGIQDGVPSSIRSRVIFNYVMKNFKIFDRVDNFIVYKKI